MEPPNLKTPHQCKIRVKYSCMPWLVYLLDVDFYKIQNSRNFPASFRRIVIKRERMVQEWMKAGARA